MDDGYINISDTVAEKLAMLPDQPGCYLMKDRDGRILYVGKAKSLKNRVSSYFHRSADLTRRKRRMVFEIRDLDFVVVDTEREAFILENNLIKKHLPPYNVLLKDDKSYPYITVTLSDPYPRVLVRHKLRRNKNDRDRYFGPYTDGAAVKDTVALIRRIFRVPCGYREPDKAKKGCMYWHIGQCIGVCAGKASREEYMEAINDVMSFLEGKRGELIKELRERMLSASDNMDYELAARLRDQIRSIERISGSQSIISGDLADRDIIALSISGRFACVYVIQMRRGCVIGQNSYELSNADEEAPEAALTGFISSYYSDVNTAPSEILVNYPAEDGLSDALSTVRGSRTTIIKPQRGKKRELLHLAVNNASKQLDMIKSRFIASEQFNTDSLAELAEAAGMDHLPLRIECYDISHIQGDCTVASLVTFTDGIPNKSMYRHFRLKTTEGKPDDFASMKEALTRRLTGSLRKTPAFEALPDLFVIDGGKGQLSAVLDTFVEAGVEGARVISLAKRDEIIFLEDMSPVALPKRSRGLMLLQRIRDEAHRFAITHHRSLRSGAIRSSSLQKIEGIGPSRSKALIKAFGSLEKIKAADIKALASVPGISHTYAQRIYDHFRSAQEDQTES
ncbi:MAG: excinuclease ABC subunit UvrC [Abditibacteriota bacterium]|nr:excinuclease ABC subunit UvrC [Abditibacteriota bacterium]